MLPPTIMPPMMAPPGAPSLPGQMNGVPRPPVVAQPSVSGSTAAPTPPVGAPSMARPPTYQANQAAATSGGLASFNVNAPAPEANHQSGSSWHGLLQHSMAYRN